MNTLIRMTIFSILLMCHANLTVGQCTASLGRAAGNYLRTTGDEELDRELRLEVRRLEKMYRVTSRFGFYDDSSSPNANAQPGTGEVDGVVRVGVTIVTSEIDDPHYGPSAVVGILAHEYVHVLQFRRGTHLTGPEMELQADFIAGWYLARQSWTRELSLKGFTSSLYDMGDWNFYSPRHHGTPDQRFRAALKGYKNAEYSLDEIFELSEEYVTTEAFFQPESQQLMPASLKPAHAATFKLQSAVYVSHGHQTQFALRLTTTADSSEIGMKIADEAKNAVVEFQAAGIRNRFGGGESATGKYSDCSHFVHDVFERVLGHPVPYVSTTDFESGHTPQWLTPVPKGEKPHLGDLMVQGGHMAIFVGEKDGAPMGAQLASKAGPSIRAFGPKGYFAHPEDLRFYRLNNSMS